MLERKRKSREKRHTRRGQAYTEFILILPIFLVIIAGITTFGQALYARLAVDAAAWSGCRHAVATLNPARGQAQAILAVRYALSGFGLNPDSAQVQVTNWGAWQRGTQVRVSVCYEVPSPPVPLGEIFAPRHVCARQKMPTHQYKSRW